MGIHKGWAFLPLLEGEGAQRADEVFLSDPRVPTGPLIRLALGAIHLPPQGGKGVATAGAGFGETSHAE